jgi:hypothetical protein
MNEPPRISTISEEARAAKRVDKVIEAGGDNRDVTPEDILLTALKELRELPEGERPGSAYVLLVSGIGRSWNVRTYRANLGRDQEVALLALTQASTIEDWRTS